MQTKRLKNGRCGDPDLAHTVILVGGEKLRYIFKGVDLNVSLFNTLFLGKYCVHEESYFKIVELVVGNDGMFNEGII